MASLAAKNHRNQEFANSMANIFHSKSIDLEETQCEGLRANSLLPLHALSGD